MQGHQDHSRGCRKLSSAGAVTAKRHHVKGRSGRLIYLAPAAAVAPAPPCLPAGAAGRPYRGGGVRIFRAVRDRFLT